MIDIRQGNGIILSNCRAPDKTLLSMQMLVNHGEKMTFQEFTALVTQTRTIRRFREDQPISLETLHELIDLARVSPSGKNAQPIRFITVTGPKARTEVFEQVAWAGAIKDWPGPAEGERPTAYIVMLEDKQAYGATVLEDVGIAAQVIMLGARVLGLGCCMLGSVKREHLRATWNLPEHYRIQLVLALGAPAEYVQLEPMPEKGNVDYWRDVEGLHHVPKHDLGTLILEEKTD